MYMYTHINIHEYSLGWKHTKQLSDILIVQSCNYQEHGLAYKKNNLLTTAESMKYTAKIIMHVWNV